MQETWDLGWKIPWRRAWQPTPVVLPGESHGQWSMGHCLLGYLFLSWLPPYIQLLPEGVRIIMLFKVNLISKCPLRLLVIPWAWRSSQFLRIGIRHSLTIPVCPNLFIRASVNKLPSQTINPFSMNEKIFPELDSSTPFSCQKSNCGWPINQFENQI